MDRPGYSNTVEHLHASQNKKQKQKSLVQHTHTQIFSNTLILFLNHHSYKSGQRTAMKNASTGFESIASPSTSRY